MSSTDILVPAALERPARRGWWRTTPTVLALLVVAALLVFVVFGRLVTPTDPDRQDLVLGMSYPGAEHWLGTDQLGRDVLSRVIVGTGGAIAGPLLVALLAILVGSTLGLVAGYHRGPADTVIGRFVDVVYALPALLIAIVVVGISGGGYGATVLVLALLSVPTAIRMVRSATIAEASKPYVEAARSLRLSSARIMSRHILPNIMATVVATFLLDFVIAMIAFSALAFLGIGAQPGSASWGVMIADGRANLLVNPCISLAPAVMVILTAASGTVLGDALYDRLSSGGSR